MPRPAVSRTARAWRWAGAGLLALAGLAALAPLAPRPAAADLGLPADLELVAAREAGFISLRPADLAAHDLVKKLPPALRDQVFQARPPHRVRVEQRMGVARLEAAARPARIWVRPGLSRPRAACEGLGRTGPLRALTPTDSSKASEKTIVECPSEKKNPTLKGRLPSLIIFRVVLSIADM